MSDRFDLSKARVAAILNRKAGSGNGDSVQAMLEKQIAPACASFTAIRPAKGESLTDIAAKAARDHDLVIAVGGDGTQAAIAQALADMQDAPVMGVIPGGTFNYFARDLGVGDTPEDAVATLLNARIAPVSVGDMNGKIFLNNISLGAYPRDTGAARGRLSPLWPAPLSGLLGGAAHADGPAPSADADRPCRG